MIVLAFVVFGALFGVLIARRHGGKKIDMAQYGAALAVAFGLIGMILTIIIARMG